jgi:hypothetical protein
MNAHYEKASELLEANESGPTYVDPNTLGLSIASTEATLALAYEQRTANLIALLDAGYSTAKVAGVDYTEVADQIKERLGL